MPSTTPSSDAAGCEGPSASVNVMAARRTGEQVAMGRWGERGRESQFLLSLFSVDVDMTLKESSLSRQTFQCTCSVACSCTDKTGFLSYLGSSQAEGQQEHAGIRQKWFVGS